MYKYPETERTMFSYLKKRNRVFSENTIRHDENFKHFQEFYFPYSFKFLDDVDELDEGLIFIYDGLNQIRKFNFSKVNINNLVFDISIKENLPECIQKNSLFYCIKDSRKHNPELKTFIINNRSKNFKFVKNLCHMNISKSYNFNKVGSSCLFFLALYKLGYYNNDTNIRNYRLLESVRLSIFHHIHILSISNDLST